jgi:hypothetical protein
MTDVLENMKKLNCQKRGKVRGRQQTDHPPTPHILMLLKKLLQLQLEGKQGAL